MISNLYVCTFKSDKDFKYLNVVAHSPFRAVAIALDHISLLDDADTYQLINVLFSDTCFINEKSF